MKAGAKKEDLLEQIELALKNHGDASHNCP
jgi:hypothetical protein